MVDPISGLVVVIATLTVFVWIGCSVRTRELDVEDFTVARNSQPASALGLSFLASGMGAWILFAPPEIGAGVGAVAVAGYALGAAGPFVVFGLLGPRLRRIVPAGHSLTEFLRLRFGRTFHRYVIGVSVAYMLLFVTAELTAIGAVGTILAGVDAQVTIIAVAVATLAYTAWGGLRASLRTDRWQSYLILVLLAVATASIVLGSTATQPGRATARDLMAVDALGLEVAATLVIAVIAANLFHQGYWQRVWAARDERALRGGVWLGVATTVPVVAAVGTLGILAAGRGLDLGDPPAPIFALLAGSPTWLVLGALALALALVASSVDTLESGLASLVTAERPTLSLSGARVATVVLMVPAVALALQGYSVLQLFLIADLLCAATVVPALSCLWRRATPAGALSGAIAGLVGAVLPGLVATGSLVEGVGRALFPDAIPTLPEFTSALIASAVTTVGVSLLAGRECDLEALGATVAPHADAAYSRE